jgi:acyl-CoA synthetase (AMP-forming)/AMP-acid ligase II
MTEISMGISNPVEGVRRPVCCTSFRLSECCTFVSFLFGDPSKYRAASGNRPFIHIKILSEDGKDVTKIANVPGMLYINGPQVFKEYWNLPDAMRSRKLVGKSGLSLGITRR